MNDKYTRLLIPALTMAMVIWTTAAEDTKAKGKPEKTVQPKRIVEITKTGKRVKIASPEGWVSIETYKYWPFKVLPADQRTEFHTALIALLETAHAAGHSPYLNDMESLIGFGTPERRVVEYVQRGRNRYWEPWLTDCGRGLRLGPVFGLPEYACVVFDGIGDVAIFTMRWLDGATLEDALDGLSVFHRMDTRTALRINA